VVAVELFGSELADPRDHGGDGGVLFGARRSDEPAGELFAYEPFAPRVWELRQNVTAYDGWYVALAELLGATLATLDVRLTKAAGPR
jgi:hypothetical protein